MTLRIASFARALLVLALCALPLGAQKSEIPRPDGWVTDLAGVLSSAEEHDLAAKLIDFEKRSAHEIALLTVESTKGVPIESFALDTFRSWKLGKPGKNDGALVVIAVNDRKLRIEVGRGLEGVLTDAFTGRVIRDVMLPRLREKQYALALSDCLAQLIPVADGTRPPPPPRNELAENLVPILIGITVLVAMIFLARMRRRFGPPGFGRGGGGMFLGGGFGGFGSGHSGGGFSGGGFGGFGGGGGASGGGASGGW